MEADERTMYRDHTKEIQIGSRVIGGGNPIAVQSMTNTKTENAAATIAQILQLEEAGCEIIRSTVPTVEAAEAFRTIKNAIHIPIVADIHFDYRLAIAAMENGADAIRINPGNIGSLDRIRAVVDCAKEKNIPIRVGVNSGSLEKEIIAKYGRVTAEGLVESALDKTRIIEEMGYDRMVISIKSSDVLMCVKAHEIIAEKTDYPLHVGITEAGTVFSGTVKSSVGLGMILGQGIGDTIRVSLTGDPVEEVRVGKRILQTLGLRRGYIEVVSCPTCGRTQIDLISLANSVEKMVEGIPLDLRRQILPSAAASVRASSCATEKSYGRFRRADFFPRSGRNLRTGRAIEGPVSGIAPINEVIYVSERNGISKGISKPGSLSGDSGFA